MSAATDNCFRYVAVVYSRSLRKGITVERRRRKTSGPKAQGAQDSGVASGRFVRSTVVFPSCYSSRLQS